MKKASKVFLATLVVGLVTLASCEQDENTAYEIEAIDKDDVQPEDER